LQFPLPGSEQANAMQTVAFPQVSVDRTAGRIPDARGKARGGQHDRATGVEWIVEAYGCNRTALADRQKLHALFERLIRGLELKPVRQPTWHRFAGTGGITGFCLLAESHLTCHTFPEFGSLCLNVFCCRQRPAWDFRSYLKKEFAAGRVEVRRLVRRYWVSPAFEA